MARQTNAALVFLLMMPALLAIMAGEACAETLVLAAADSRPTAFMIDGKPTGMLVDLVTEAYRRAGQPVEIRLMPWVRCLGEARSGNIDGVFSSFKLPEREEFLAFSKEPLTTQVIAFFARLDSPLSFDGDLGKLREVKIGVIKGTSYGRKFDVAVADGTLRNVEESNSVDSNLKKLAFGRVDLIPSYRFVVLDTARQLDLLSRIKEVSPPVDEVPTYLAFTKVRDLRKQSEGFDAALASMKQDGTYDRIIERYPH
jgi:polar amino acid transport system substrate-binding protein